MPSQQNVSIGAGGGGFLRILGIIYLIKIIRRRRGRQRPVPDERDAPS